MRCSLFAEGRAVGMGVNAQLTCNSDFCYVVAYEVPTDHGNNSNYTCASWRILYSST